jgi:hypothetical protein
VTTVDAGANRCTTTGWWGDSSQTTVQVACRTSAGSLIDTPYIVNLSSQEFLFY